MYQHFHFHAVLRKLIQQIYALIHRKKYILCIIMYIHRCDMHIQTASFKWSLNIIQVRHRVLFLQIQNLNGSEMWQAVTYIGQSSLTTMWGIWILILVFSHIVYRIKWMNVSGVDAYSYCCTANIFWFFMRPRLLHSARSPVTPTKYSILHSGISSQSLGYIGCLPKPRYFNSARASSHTDTSLYT
jgi:hypothetical protein